MKNSCTVRVYQALIQYILETTDYSLNDIADHLECSPKSLKKIYLYEEMPSDIFPELKLVDLYRFIFEINNSKGS